jgi:hypothetical protein
VGRADGWREKQQRHFQKQRIVGVFVVVERFVSKNS